MRRSAAPWFAVALFAAGTAMAPPVAAQPSTEVRAAAVALFDDARKLAAAGNYQEACPKFAESQRMDPGVGTLYNLADCYEHIGRTASAWSGFRDVAAAAAQAGQLEREKVARERADALLPKLTRVRVIVGAGSRAPGLALVVGGVPLGEPMWGTALPVDPGRVTVHASAPDRQTWESAVEASGAGATVDVQIPPLSARAAAASIPVGPAASTRPVEPRPVPVADSAPTAWQRPVGLAIAGLGLAGVGVGVALGLVAKSKHDDASCNERDYCDQPGLDARDDAVVLGNVGTAVFLGGAALAVGGVVLFLTAPRGPVVTARVTASRLWVYAPF